MSIVTEYAALKLNYKFTIYLNVQLLQKYRPGETSCYEVFGSSLLILLNF